jgi:hypothetical protein
MPAEGACDAGQTADRPDPQSLRLEVVRIIRLLEDVIRAAVISPGASVVGEVFTRTSEAQQHRDNVPMIGSALPLDETEGAYGEALGLDGPTALAEVGGDVQKPAGFFHPMPVLDTFREQVRSSRAGDKSNCSTCIGAHAAVRSDCANDWNFLRKSPSRWRSRSPAGTTDPIRSDRHTLFG